MKMPFAGLYMQQWPLGTSSPGRVRRQLTAPFVERLALVKVYDTAFSDDARQGPYTLFSD